MTRDRLVNRSWLFAAGVVAMGACTSILTEPPPGGSAGSGGTAGMGGAASSAASSSTGGACGTHCSEDLHSLLDCHDQVVMTCPPDQGCGATGCVPACQSAVENKSSVGCEYFAVDPDAIPEAAGACFAATIVNTWNAPVTITVDRAGQTFDTSTFAYGLSGPLSGPLPPGDVAFLLLADGEGNAACAVPGVAQKGIDAAVHGTGMGDAFHITVSAPVAAFTALPFEGGSTGIGSATVLIPTSVWDTNYVAVNAYRKSTLIPAAQPSLDIVAAEDGTQVSVSSPSGPMTYTLDRGQILQLTQDDELTGSAIQSNKPIGVWGGATCLNIPVDVGTCDVAQQQIPPVQALGREYVAVRYRDRFDGVEESPPWRIVGIVDGTMLTYEPAAPEDAPTTIGKGQVLEFRAPGPFVVRSQNANHPFYMSAHMTGCGELSPGNDDCRGDPEFVNVVPPLQYQRSYRFFTDPTFPETNLVVVRRSTPSGFADVTLDCAGTLGGWQPVGSSGDYELTRVDLVRHHFQPQGGCDNGLHEMHSEGPFGVTVWGWGSLEAGTTTVAVSYAYPAGAGARWIGTMSLPPPDP